MNQSELSSRDRENVVVFLVRLSQSPGVARAFEQDADTALDSMGLSAESRALLKARDQSRIAAALGRTGVEI